MENMTIEQLQELIRSTVHEVRREEIEEGAHAAKGLAKAERWWKIGQIIAFFGGIFVAAFLVVNSYMVAPQSKQIAEQVARQMMVEHNADVQRKMEGIQGTYLLKSEFQSKLATQEERWRQLDIDIAEIKVSLVKVQDHQLEILRKMK